MSQDLKTIFSRCRTLGIILELSPDGERLALHYDSPPPEDLRQELLQHKPEILSLLKSQPPQWHAEAITAAVRREGVCIFWSDLFGEMVAFIKDETFKGRVPCGIVAYTDQELKELFGGNRSPKALKLVHEAKKYGGRVASYNEDTRPKPSGGETHDWC